MPCRDCQLCVKMFDINWCRSASWDGALGSEKVFWPMDKICLKKLVVVWGFFWSDKMTDSGNKWKEMCGFVASVFQALGVTIKHPVVLAVAVQLFVQSLHWPVARAENPLSHPQPFRREDCCFSSLPFWSSTTHCYSLVFCHRCHPCLCCYVLCRPIYKKKHLALLFIRETSLLSASLLPLWLVPVASQQWWLVNAGQEL